MQRLTFLLSMFQCRHPCDTSGITNTWSSATVLVVSLPRRGFTLLSKISQANTRQLGEGVIATLAPQLGDDLISSTNGPLTNGVGQNESATGSKSFTYLSGNTVDVVNVASGGSVPESVEKIRRLAPRAYASQNRAVTANDIQALVENNFSGFSSVLAFGGQDANPPQYGRVIVCLKPNANETISSTLKSQIESYLKTKCPVSIQPSVVEPDLIYVRADTSVRFNENQTPLTETTMASLCKDLIRNYLVDNTRDFDTTVTGTCCRKVLPIQTHQLFHRPQFFDLRNVLFHHQESLQCNSNSATNYFTHMMVTLALYFQMNSTTPTQLV